MPGLQPGTLTMAYNDAEELCWSFTGTSTNGCASPPTGATSYTFDGAGAMTAGGTGTGALGLVYNVIGQTTSIDPAGSAGAVPMTYAGVSQDRRLSKDSLEMSYGFAGLTSQSTNSGVPHAEYFVRDPGGKLIGMVDAKTSNSEPDQWYLMDGQDSIMATIDTTGEVRRYAYEPYGEQIRTWIDPTPTNTSSSGMPADGSYNAHVPGVDDEELDLNPWRYASGYHDTETGMLKYGTRYYTPSLSRWTQSDPAPGHPGTPLSLNPYLYSLNNPINRIDPSGMLSFGDLGLFSDIVQMADELQQGDYGDFLAYGAGTLVGGYVATNCGARAVSAIETGPGLVLAEAACYVTGSFVSAGVTDIVSPYTDRYNYYEF